MRQLCQALAVAPSSYYYRGLPNDDLSVLAWIEEVLLEFPTYGVPRVTAELERRQHSVNHKRVQRIMRQNDLIRVVRRRVSTADSRHGYPHYPNLLRNCQLMRPDQGVQYAAIGYTELLQAAGIQTPALRRAQRGASVSMSAVGRPTDNPYAERVIRTISVQSNGLTTCRTLFLHFKTAG